MAAVTPRVAAQQDSVAGASVQERLESLDQKVKVLERLREIAQDSIAAAAKTRVSATAGAEGFSLKSADGNFVVRFRGYVQSDGRFFPGDNLVPQTNTFLIRRARPIFEATVYKYIDFRLMPDFGQGTTVLFDAYSEIRFDPALALRAGKFKPPVDIERLQSATDLRFLERAFTTNLAPNRDVGLQLGGDLSGGTVNYAVGVFNGVPDLGNGDLDVSDAKDFAARVFLQPFLKHGPKSLSGLGLGLAATTGIERGTLAAPALPAYKSPGQVTVFKYRSDGTLAGTAYANGHRRRLLPQGYFNVGSLGLLGEYAISEQDVTRAATTARLKHHAWQIAGSYFLTGEKASYRSVTPRKTFDPKAGHWGALELAARYSELKLDDATFPTFASPTSNPSDAKAWAVGLNWHLARNVKIMLDYEETRFLGGASGGLNREKEHFVGARVQSAF
jgi:phosphate-selective porin OprO/OprP